MGVDTIYPVYYFVGTAALLVITATALLSAESIG